MIYVVAGTRPEIIKMAPIIRELNSRNYPYKFIFFGQHYDYNMSYKFIEELELPDPDMSFRIKTIFPAVQVARVMVNMEKILVNDNAHKRDSRLQSIVLVQGDTNTTLAASLAVNKQNILLGHVEAGLRSYDLRMPEEHNRRLVDHISNYLFAPTEIAKENLIRENVWGEIYVTGNTVIDACQQHFEIAIKKNNIKKIIDFKENDWVLLTLHRAENVDNINILKEIISAIIDIKQVNIIFPIHPRTKKRLMQFNLYGKIKSTKHIKVIPPVGYFDMLVLMKNVKLILTDSGGIQEEATAPIIHKPVIVLRESTERPEAVKTGFAKVVGVKKEKIINSVNDFLQKQWDLPKQSPFGDGNAAKRIVSILKDVVEV